MRIDDDIHEVHEGEVRYPYADVGAPGLLHIGKVNQENRKDFKFICPNCRKTLLPRLGNGSRRSHFAHYPGECCDPDRYIHSTAERLLKEKWERDEPFEITMKVKTACKHHPDCVFGKTNNRCISSETKTYDLKKYYSTCLVEKKHGAFIPDLCLTDVAGKHEPIFIEIWNTHKNSEKKAESDNMIIEIRLRTVADLEELPRHPITESDTVTFSHFKHREKEPDETVGPKLLKYTLYAGTLKSYVDADAVSCANYKTNHHHKAVLEIVGLKEDFGSVYLFWKYCNAIAVDKGYNIRSCNLCRHYGEDKSTTVWDAERQEYTNPGRGCRRDFEKQGIIQCKPDDARTCEHFLRKDYSLKKIKNTYANAALYIWERHQDGTVTEESREGKDKPEDAVDASAPFSINYPYYHLV
jgi:hypothetical protein